MEGLKFEHFSLQTPDYLETFGVAGLIWPGVAPAPESSSEILEWVMTMAWTLWADEDLVDEVALAIEEAVFAGDDEAEKAARRRLKLEVRKLRRQIPIDRLPAVVEKFRVLAERIQALDFDTVPRGEDHSTGEVAPGNS